MRLNIPLGSSGITTLFIHKKDAHGTTRTGLRIELPVFASHVTFWGTKLQIKQILDSATKALDQQPEAL